MRRKQGSGQAQAADVRSTGRLVIILMAAACAMVLSPACGGDDEGAGTPDVAGDTRADPDVADTADRVDAPDADTGPDADADDADGDEVADAADDAADDAAGDADALADAPQDATGTPCLSTGDCLDHPVGPCETPICDQSTATCAASPIGDGEACEDGNLCTTAEQCVAGRCLATAAVVCDDGNACTDDSCDPLVGCVFSNNFAACDNGDPCTIDDRCGGGQCGAGRPKCFDDNPCTDERCEPDGRCIYDINNIAPCSDGSECTQGDFCAGGLCIAGSADGCADGNPCTSASCADDGLSCEVVNLDSKACDDDDVCTVGDLCQGGVCQPGEALDCGGHPDCVQWECHPVTGCALIGMSPDVACDDGDACTDGDTCDATGQCLPTGVTSCDDNRVCTVDTCEPDVGCRHTAITGACDDNNACTTDDRCQGVFCRGTTQSCNDGDACTLDRCDPLVGCESVPDGLNCDDANPCTDDTCDPQSGCVHTFNDAPCDDDDVCTAGDVCDAGKCTGTGDPCDDDDPCTVDLCDDEEGCFNEAYEGECDDGDRCTQGETCGADGRCDGSTLVDPDDGVACTVDSCDPDTGVSNTPDHGTCPVGEACDPSLGCATVIPVMLVSKLMLDPGIGSSEPGFGQWVQLTNATDAVLDIGSFRLRTLDNPSVAAIKPVGGTVGDALLVSPGASVTGLKATAPLPDGGSAGWDFLFGAAGDGFAFDATGDTIQLIDGADKVVDGLVMLQITAGPSVTATQFPVVSGLPVELDAGRLGSADEDADNDLARDWCVHREQAPPGSPARSCRDVRLNEVQLAGPTGQRWIELYLAQGGTLGGTSVRVVAADGDVLFSRTLSGRMKIGQPVLLRDAVDGVALPQLTEGSVQVIQANQLNDVYGFGTLTAVVDELLALPLAEGTPGPAQTVGSVAIRPVDGADTDDNAADWTHTPQGSPGEFNAPQ